MIWAIVTMGIFLFIGLWIGVANYYHIDRLERRLMTLESNAMMKVGLGSSPVKRKY